MAVLPFGYVLDNGTIKVDEESAEKVRLMFRAYLSGKSYIESGRAAGLGVNHSSVKNILCNQKYLGDDVYPPIVDPELFGSVRDLMTANSDRVISKRRVSAPEVYEIPTSFQMSKIRQLYDDPYKQAEYIYSLIERRQNGE